MIDRRPAADRTRRRVGFKSELIASSSSSSTASTSASSTVATLVGRQSDAALSRRRDKLKWSHHVEVAARGLMLSEYPPGQPPRPHHFPVRNRLISGLCEGVLVVEAAWASGSLITARWAADQGKAVFALPGRVDHPMARGTLRLLREGATAVGSPEELAEDLFGSVPAVLQRSGESPGSPTPRDPLGILRPCAARPWPSTTSRSA